MQTVVQELIDDLKELKKDSKERNKDTSFDIGMTFAIARAELRLEKEKEQIINFCWECLRGDNIHAITSNKELIEYINNKYNQTYNQNK